MRRKANMYMQARKWCRHKKAIAASSPGRQGQAKVVRHTSWGRPLPPILGASLAKAAKLAESARSRLALLGHYCFAHE